MNQFLKKIEAKLWESEVLTKKEQEYYNRNKYFNGIVFDYPIEITLSDNNRNYYYEQVNENVDKIVAYKLLGETEDEYHLSWGNQEVFLKKDFDLYKAIWSSHSKIDFDKLNSKFKYTLEPYQETGVEFLCFNKSAILCDTAGLGKTFTSIGAVVEKDYQKVLVICLANIKPNWRNELKAWNIIGNVIGGKNKNIARKRYSSKRIAEEKRADFNSYDFEVQTELIKKGLKLNVIDWNSRLPENYSIDSITNDFSKWTVDIKKGKTKKDGEYYELSYSLENPFENLKCQHFDIINYDILQKYEHILTSKKYDCIIIDESHAIKHKKTKRLESFSRIIANRYVKSIWAMTATPFQKNHELWNLLNNLRFEIPNLTAHPNAGWTEQTKMYNNYFEKFVAYTMGETWVRDRFGKAKKKTFMQVGVKVGNELNYNENTTCLGQIMKSYMLRRYKEKELKNFAPIYFEQLNITLSDSQVESINKAFHLHLEKKIKMYLGEDSEMLKILKSYGYKDGVLIEYITNILENQNFGELDPVEESFVEMLEKIVKTEKLVSNSLGAGLTAKYKTKDTLKLTKENINDGKKVLIFTTKIDEIESLATLFDKNNIKCFHIGRTDNTPEKKENKKNEFQKCEEPCVLIGNIVSMGTGLNIQAADVVIFNSLVWSWDLIEQAYSRAWRKGRTDAVFVYFMVADETIDTVMLNRAYAKRNNSEDFFVE